MAPLLEPALMHDSCEDVFSLWPLKLELEAASWETRSPARQIIVRFEENSEVINPSPEFFTDEDVKVKWYSMDDLQQIKLRAKEESME